MELFITDPDKVVAYSDINAIIEKYKIMVSEISDPSRKLAPWEKLMKHIMEQPKLFALVLGYKVISCDTSSPNINICNPNIVVLNQEAQQIKHVQRFDYPFMHGGCGWFYNTDTVTPSTTPPWIKFGGQELCTHVSLK
jgi:hypothetical protein